MTRPAFCFCSPWIPGGRRVSRVVTLSVALLLAAAVAPSADATRRASLHGNLLLEDPEDIYTYPQRTLDYRNLVRFDLGSSEDSGDALLIFGSQTFAMGIAAHRSDAMMPSLYHRSSLGASSAEALQAGSPNVWADTDPTKYADADTQPYTVADILISWEVPRGLVGGRLMIGNGGNTETLGGSNTNSRGQTVITLSGGFSMVGDFRLDTAMNLSIDFANDVVGGEGVDSGFGFGMGLNGRGVWNQGEGVDIGFLGSLGFYNQSLDTSIGDTTVASSRGSWIVAMGLGPVYRLEDKAIIGAYGLIGAIGESGDPNHSNVDDETAVAEIIIPGMRLATELWLLDWLALRAGAEYSYTVITSSEPRTTTDPNVPTAIADSTDFQGTFGWSTGIGMTRGDFAFDATVNHSYLHAGPAVFTGNSGDVFTNVTMAYTF